MTQDRQETGGWGRRLRTRGVVVAVVVAALAASGCSTGSGGPSVASVPGRVYALEANSYFSRPGPRLVTGIEALADVFHPGIKVSEEAQRVAFRMSAPPLSARAASI